MNINGWTFVKRKSGLFKKTKSEKNGLEQKQKKKNEKKKKV